MKINSIKLSDDINQAIFSEENSFYELESDLNMVVETLLNITSHLQLYAQTAGHLASTRKPEINDEMTSDEKSAQVEYADNAITMWKSLHEALKIMANDTSNAGEFLNNAKTQIKQLRDVVSNYNDNHYKIYNSYNKSIRLIRIKKAAKAIAKIEKEMFRK